MTLTIGIDPVAFTVAGIEIRWYGLAVAASIAVAVVLARRGARRAGIDVALVDDAALWIGIAALAGGRLLYLVQNELGDLAAHPLLAFAIWHGGLSFYGGLVAGLVALAAWARRRSLTFGMVADLAAPAVAAGQAVGHLGCLVGGDSYGVPTSGPLGVVYTHPDAMAPRGVALVPTQAYEAAALALLAAVLWASRGRLERIGPGVTAAVYLLGNAAIRFGLFFLRDDAIVAGGLKVAQLIALGIAAAGVVWLIAIARGRVRRVGSLAAIHDRSS